MFGPEASGLSNEDLSFSNYVLQIPTSPKFKSLNLSGTELYKSLSKFITLFFFETNSQKFVPIKPDPPVTK